MRRGQRLQSPSWLRRSFRTKGARIKPGEPHASIVDVGCLTHGHVVNLNGTSTSSDKNLPSCSSQHTFTRGSGCTTAQFSRESTWHHSHHSTIQNEENHQHVQWVIFTLLKVFQQTTHLLTRMASTSARPSTCCLGLTLL